MTRTLFYSNSAKVEMGLLGSLSLVCGTPPGVTEIGGFPCAGFFTHRSGFSRLLGPLLSPHSGLTSWLRLLTAWFFQLSHTYRCQLAFKKQEQKFSVQLMFVIGTGAPSFPHTLFVRAARGHPSSQEAETSAPPLNGGGEGKVTLQNIWDGRTLLWQTL